MARMAASSSLFRSCARSRCIPRCASTSPRVRG
jgi:hypothetical protein